MDSPVDLGRLRALSAQIASCVDELGVHTEDGDEHYNSRMQLLDSLSQAQQLLTTGGDFITQLAAQNNQFHCVRWLLHFNIPSLVPLPRAVPSTAQAGGTDVSSNGIADEHVIPSRSFMEVAEQARVPEYQLRRISRMAMLCGFFSEPSGGRLAHSPLSAAFARSPGLIAWAEFVTSSSAPMVTKMVEATEKWARDPAAAAIPLPPNATAYSIAWDTDLPTFKHVASVPELGKRFAEYLRYMTVNKAASLEHLVDAFPTSSLAEGAGPGVVIDIGGGLGQASFALATAHSNLRCLIQDLPEIVARAETRAASAEAISGDPRVQNAVAFEVHDFFEPQTPRLPPSVAQQWNLPAALTVSSSEDVEHVRDVDAFLLRQILHDWPDDKAAIILRNLIPRLRPNGRIVIMETVLPDPTGGTAETSTLPSSSATDTESAASRKRIVPQTEDVSTNKKRIVSEAEGTGDTAGQKAVMQADEAGMSKPRVVFQAEEAGLRIRDLTMLQSHNAQEREMSEWRALIAKADPRLRLDKVTHPRGSYMSLLELIVAND